MKFQASGDRKDLRARVEDVRSQAAARKLGLQATCRAGKLEIVLAWRYRTPQYAFCGTVSETGELNGEIELVGKKRQWYDVLLLVLCCVLVLPFFVLLLVGSPAILSSHSMGDDPVSSEKRFGLPFGSKAGREKNLMKYLTEVLQCRPIDRRLA